MRAFFAVTVYCISLLQLLLALPMRSPLESNRLDFMTRSDQLSLENSISPEVTEHTNSIRDVSIDHTALWRTILSRPPPSASENPVNSQPMEGESNEVGGVLQHRGSKVGGVLQHRGSEVGGVPHHRGSEVGGVPQHRGSEVGGVPQQRGLRGRRHTIARGHHNRHHVKLMRVGCVLGTCQVQNLSHRLFQFTGQNGREDSAPVNPRSPHSYG